MRHLSLLSVAVALLLMPLCMQAPAASVPSRTSPLQAALANVTGQEIDLWDWVQWHPSIAALYARRGFVPLWFTEGRLTRAGAQLLDELAHVEQRGLIVGDYDSARVVGLIKGTPTAGVLEPDRMARFDIALSVTAARLRLRSAARPRESAQRGL